MKRLSQFIIDLMSDNVSVNPSIVEDIEISPAKIDKIKDVLINHPDEFDFVEIAQLAGVSETIVAQIADKLIRQGFIGPPDKTWAHVQDDTEWPVDEEGFPIDLDEVSEKEPSQKRFVPRHLIKQAKPTTIASFIKRRKKLPEDIQREIYWMIIADDINNW
jgi:hypothetical protein